MADRRGCDEARLTKCDVLPLKGPLRVRGVRLRIAELEQFIRDGEAIGNEMCEQFARQFPVAPAKPVRYKDRSLTFYRWRQSGSKSWGSNAKTAINLMGEAGLELLGRVPESARKQWLQYERRRIELNTQLATASYELYRLQDWLDASDTIKKIESDGIESIQR